MKCRLCKLEGTKDELKLHLKRVHHIRGKQSFGTDPQRHPINFYIENENSPYYKKEIVGYARWKLNLVNSIIKIINKVINLFNKITGGKQ